MTRFDKLVEILGQNLEGFEVRVKEESTLMKIISRILFFNKAFMTGFITTIGRTVYWPKQKLEDSGSIVTLTHEYQHAKDAAKRTSFLFGILYLFPLILALPGVLLALASPVWIALMACGVIAWSWWLLPFLLTLVFLAPIPAPWRTHYEVKASMMGLFTTNELLKERGLSVQNRIEILQSQADRKEEMFTGPAYYFMWPFGVKEELYKAIQDIISEKILEEDDIYREIAQALKDSK